MKLFAKPVNRFKSFIIFAKCFILDVWQGSGKTKKIHRLWSSVFIVNFEQAIAQLLPRISIKSMKIENENRIKSNNFLCISHYGQLCDTKCNNDNNNNMKKMLQ